MSRIRSTAFHVLLHATLLIAIVAAVATSRARTLRAATTPESAAAAVSAPADNWLKGLTGTHRQLFDAPAPAGGVPLAHILNYYETYNKAYGVKDADIDAVLTFYGTTTFHALADRAWEKYGLGEIVDAVDATTGKPATRNPWRVAPAMFGTTVPQASIESLQQRGVTMIVCNNALQFFAGVVAAKRGLEAGAVYEDLKASILPGVELVPGMVVAIEQAKRAGLSYHQQ